MPLQIAVTDTSGVTSTYWVVSSAHADFQNQVLSVSLVGYLDATSYTNGLTPSSRRNHFFTVPFSEIPSIAQGSLSMDEIYSAVMAQANDPARTRPSPLAGATVVA